MESPLLLRFVRKLRNLRHKRVVLAQPGVKIHPTAKVDYSGINIHPDVRLEIGAGAIFEGNIISERPGAAFFIGNHSFVGGSSLIAAERIEIGEDVLIAWGCTIVDHNAHSIVFEKRCLDVREWYYGRKDWSSVPIKPVRIRNGAWIGLNSMVLKGVTVGERAVVGAGSVVVRDVPPDAVYLGNPARSIFEFEL